MLRWLNCDSYLSIECLSVAQKQERYSICNKEYSLEEESNTGEGNDENRVIIEVKNRQAIWNLAFWQDFWIVSLVSLQGSLSPYILLERM